ncbi:hypothetical protein LIER_28977 [Lithospermum erythrorhizon]|uniref:Uncharacterized protein n=1 Tax=Lithospermum erythrorhizon TaxID=34254 RepID=A0AAV3RHP3_LITER
MKACIPLEGESVDAPSTKIEAPKDGEPEVSGFVEEVLVTLDLDPGQLMPFAWLGLTVFQVACLSVGVVPNITLFSMMYNVIHKDPLKYFQVASSSYNFLSTKKVDKVEPSRRFKLWFLAQGGFGAEASKKTVPEDAPIETEVVPEKFISPPPTLAPTATIIIPDQFLALDITTYAPESSSISSPSKVSSSFDANPLGIPYSLPSGITVTEKTLLAASEKQLEELSTRPSPEVVIEKFKDGQNFTDLLIDNTVSIMKTFCLKIYEEYLCVHSLFPKFVGEHFGEEYVVPLANEEKESDDGDSDGAHSDDGLGEDEEDA